MDVTQKMRSLTRAKEIAMTVAGLTMVLTPLALWASPNLTAFYAALCTCAAAYGIFLLLSQIGAEEPAPPRRENNRTALSPELIDRLQNQRELSRNRLPELRQFVTENLQPRKKPDEG